MKIRPFLRRTSLGLESNVKYFIYSLLMCLPGKNTLILMHAFEDMSYNIVDKIHKSKWCFILHITGTILAADYSEVTAVMKHC